MRQTILMALLITLFASSLQAAKNSFTVVGDFDSYITTTQLDDLVVSVDGVLVHVACTTNDPTGCDEFNAGDTVMVIGHMADQSVCDSDPVVYYNRLIPDQVLICNLSRVCIDLAD